MRGVLVLVGLITLVSGVGGLAEAHYRRLPIPAAFVVLASRPPRQPRKRRPPCMAIIND
jgi:hypothetical protein